MKQRKSSGGRRGRKNRSHEAQLVRLSAAQERIREEISRQREAALGRILPRLRRYCPLSEVGVVKPRDGKSDDLRQDYFSLEGKIRGRVTSGGYFRTDFRYAWDTLDVVELEALAKIRRWDPVQPKDPLTIIAEAFAGLHEEL